MATTIQIRTRINKEMKLKGDKVLAQLGLDASAFVSMAYAQLVNRQAIPFSTSLDDREYFVREYGATMGELEAAGERMRKEFLKEQKAGRVTEVHSAKDLLP